MSDEIAAHVAALDSLETILFGDCWRRSRDEMEARAEALRELERAARDLLLFPFDREHPATPDGEALGRILDRIGGVHAR